MKRGRGAVGSRMDETGPYLPHGVDSEDQLTAGPSVKERPVYGPEKPSKRFSDSSAEEVDNDRKKLRKGSSKKHKSKDKSKERKKKKRREGKRSKYYD